MTLVVILVRKDEGPKQVTNSSEGEGARYSRSVQKVESTGRGDLLGISDEWKEGG